MCLTPEVCADCVFVLHRRRRSSPSSASASEASGDDIPSSESSFGSKSRSASRWSPKPCLVLHLSLAHAGVSSSSSSDTPGLSSDLISQCYACAFADSSSSSSSSPSSVDDASSPYVSDANAPFAFVARAFPDGSRTIAFCRRIAVDGNAAADVAIVLLSGLPWRDTFVAAIDDVVPAVARCAAAGRTMPETLEEADGDAAERLRSALAPARRREFRPGVTLARHLPPAPKESWRWSSVLDAGQPSLSAWLFPLCDVTVKGGPVPSAMPGSALRERITDVLHVFSAMLQERRIVVVADSVPSTANAVASLVACMYPMRWQGLLFPIVPPSQTDVLYGSMPYIAGVHANLFDKLIAMGPDVGELVLLDLRRSSESEARLTIINTSDDAIADEMRQSEEDVEAFVDFDPNDFAGSLPKRRREELEEALVYLMEKPETRYKDELALHGFLRFFVGCFASMPRHFVREAPKGGCHPDHAIIVGPSLWYDHRAFLSDTISSRRERAFFLLLRQTTHFATFIQESLEGTCRNNASKGYGGMFEYIARRKENDRRGSYTEMLKQGLQRASFFAESMRSVRRAYTTGISGVGSGGSGQSSGQSTPTRIRRATSMDSVDSTSAAGSDKSLDLCENWHDPVGSVVDPRWVVPTTSTTSSDVSVMIAVPAPAAEMPDASHPAPPISEHQPPAPPPLLDLGDDNPVDVSPATPTIITTTSAKDHFDPFGDFISLDASASSSTPSSLLVAHPASVGGTAAAAPAADALDPLKVLAGLDLGGGSGSGGGGSGGGGSDRLQASELNLL